MPRSIISYSHNVVHGIPMTYFFLLLEAEPFDPLYPFYPPITSCFCNKQPVLCTCELFKKNSTYKWDHMVFVFVWPISLSRNTSRSIHVVIKSKIPLFSWLSNIPWCTYTAFALSIHLLMDTGYFHTLAIVNRHGVHISFQVNISFSLAKYPKSHMGVLVSFFFFFEAVP